MASNPDMLHACMVLLIVMYVLVPPKRMVCKR